MFNTIVEVYFIFFILGKTLFWTLPKDVQETAPLWAKYLSFGGLIYAIKYRKGDYELD